MKFGFWIFDNNVHKFCGACKNMQRKLPEPHDFNSKQSRATPTPTPSGLSCCYCCFFIGYWGVLGRVSVDSRGTSGCSAQGKWHPIEAATAAAASAAAYSACQCISLFDNIKNSFALATSQPMGG